MTRVDRSNESQTKVTLGSLKCSLLSFLVILCTILYMNFFLDTEVCLACHDGTCQISRSSLVSSRGLFGWFRQLLSTVSPKRREEFESWRLQDVQVVEMRGGKTPTLWKVSLHLLDDEDDDDEHTQKKITEKHFYSFTDPESAEETAWTVSAAIQHAKFMQQKHYPSSQHQPPHEGITLYLQIDESWLEEFILLLLVLLEIYIFVFQPHSEDIIMNHHVGIVSVERFTLLTSALTAWDDCRSSQHRRRQSHTPHQDSSDSSSSSRGAVLNWSHMILLAPATSIQTIESIRDIRGTTTPHSNELRRPSTPIIVYSLRLLMTDRPPVDLKCSACKDRHRHEEQLRELQSCLREARDGAERARRLVEHRRGQGLRETARANQTNHNTSASSSSSAGSAGSAGGLGGGGVPGKECVVCLEQPARIAFGPCAHVCCCQVCGQNPALVRCPICRKHIAHRIGLYFS